MSEESDALEDQYWPEPELDVKAARERYEDAKRARAGDEVRCPSCGKRFVKRSHQQVFCGNRGRGNCKDYYWNRAVAERRDRAAAMGQ